MKQRTRPAAIALALALSGGGLTACGEDETIVEQAEEAPGIQLVEGERVTIEGEAERALGPNAFTVGADETLVFSSENQDVDDDDVVTVTGDVEVFTVAEIERDLGIDFEDELVVAYESELAVQADEVVITEEG